MSGGEFEIKTEPIDIKEKWQIDSNPILTLQLNCLDQPINIKKENEINDETKDLFALAADLNFVKCEPKEEFNECQDNMEKDPLELGLKYVCDICKNSYSTKFALSRHIASVHDGIEYVCDFCKKSYHDKSHLSQHIKTVHEGKKYECKTCNKAFTSSGNLKMHQSTVHEGKKFECKTCKKTFLYKSSLTKHIKTVHEENNV